MGSKLVVITLDNLYCGSSKVSSCAWLFQTNFEVSPRLCVKSETFQLSVHAYISIDLQLMWRLAMEDDSKLEHIILEVERLWPPFFGGRRLCTQVGGYSANAIHYLGSWSRA